MKHTGSLLAIAAVLALGGCQGGEVMGSVTTDYGVAKATTEQVRPGDIDSWLTTPDGEVVLGELSWDSGSHALSAQVATTTVVSEPVDLSNQALEKINLLLFRLWEIETSDNPGTTCLDDGTVICCRDTAWRCGASRIAQ